jgi:tRNA (uracil-5-)-methyltransferase
MNWSQQKLKSFLDENGVSYTSAQKRKSMKVCFLGFRSQEELTKSAEILDGMSVSNKRLKLADVLPRAWEQKAVGVTESALAGYKEEENNGEDHAMAEDGGSGDENEKKTLEPYRNVTQVVTPLAHLPYEEQLAKKKEEIIQVLKRLARNIRKGCPAGMLLPDWLAAAKDREGLPCKFEGILPSPVVDGYRNKCEFAIGLGPDGKQRVVGFQLGSFREGINAIAEPGDCQNVSKVALRFVSAFQTFIRASRLPVWNKTDNTGFWRMLTIREGREPGSADEIGKEIAEVMLVVQVCPTGVPEDRASAEYTIMAKVLIEAASSYSPRLPLTALLVQEHVGVSNSAPADCPLKALPLTGMDDAESPPNPLVEPVAHIHDYIGTSKFRISPTAFFQVNSAGAEKLYSLAGDWAGLGPDTLLFDVCCGTGAIGLTLAKKVGMVVGIEMNASAVADAQLNADLNGIKNCRFICGKAEDVISNLLKEYAVEDDDEKISEPEAENENGKISEPEADGKVSEEQVTTTAENGQQEVTKRRFKNIVAIVDPPRVGLHHVVLRTLRLHSKLKRVVYISCNPDSLLANAVELCMPIKEGPVEKQKQRGGFRGSNLGHARRRVKTLPPSEPFHPVRACAVDLFPHTKHCEMVMLFER